MECLRSRVFKGAWFARFARKEKLSDEILWRAVKRAEQGQIDADLGGGVIKLRLARPGSGKSKGYRSIVLCRKGDRAFFIFGFAKSTQGNISKGEETQFKKLAKHVLALTDEQLQLLIDNGQFTEIINDA